MALAGAEHFKAPLLYTAGLLGIVGLAGAVSGPLAHGRFAPILPFGLAAMGIIFALALAQPLILFGAGFALLGVVRTEPAPVDIVFAILILVTALSGRLSPRIPATVEVLIGLTAFVTLLSSVNAVDTRRAVQYGFVSLYLLALGVWLTWVFRDAKATRLAIKAYIGVAVVSSVLVILALYVGLPGGNLLLYDPSRGKGLFKDPNVYSAFVVPAAVIALEEIGRPRLFQWGRVKAVVLFVILAAGVVVAFSRAAWLNLAIGCATVVTVTLFRHGGVRVAARSLIGLLVAAVAGLALLSATGSIDFLKQRSKLESYDQQRFGAQDTAFNRIGEHVLGHGPGQVERTLDLSTHSLYARAAFEQGVPGLALLLILLGATLYYAVRLAGADREIHGIGSAALLGIWIGLIANGTFIDAIHWRHLYVFAALIWCCAATPPPTATHAKALARSRRPRKGSNRTDQR